MTTDRAKIKPTHLCRDAFVYLRQSTQAQLERNPESTRRQYALVDRAVELGWSREQVRLVDEDLGGFGSGLSERKGFAHMTAEAALGHVGLILGIEVSRLARNNANGYRLLNLCAVTDSLIGDGDGLYHPALFNDRLVLRLKGTMSEAESQIHERAADAGSTASLRLPPTDPPVERTRSGCPRHGARNSRPADRSGGSRARPKGGDRP